MMNRQLNRPTMVLAAMCAICLLLSTHAWAQTASRGVSRSSFSRNSLAKPYSSTSRYTAARASLPDSPWFLVTVELDKVEVLDDGDSGSYLAGGELYWRIAVRHASVKKTSSQQGVKQLVLSEVQRANSRPVLAGKSYSIKQLDRTAAVQRFRVRKGDLFWVRADFKEADQLSADDCMQPVKPASPLSVYRPIVAGSPGSKIVREYRFNHANRAAVRLYFRVTATQQR